MKRLDVFNTMDKLLNSLNVRNNKTEALMDLQKKYMKYKGLYGKYHLVINKDEVFCLSQNDYEFNPLNKLSFNMELDRGGIGFLIEIDSEIDNKVYGTFRKVS